MAQRRRHYEIARTGYAVAMRNWKEHQQWLSRLLIDREATRQEIAEVNAMRLREERKVRRIESLRGGRRA